MCCFVLTRAPARDRNRPFSDRSRAGARARLRGSLSQLRQKRFALALQILFQLLRAIAIAASPRLRAVFVAAISSRVSVLDCHQLEILFPIWTLLLEGRVAETGFDPCSDSSGIHPGLFHIVLILVSGDRAAAEHLIIDRP